MEEYLKEICAPHFWPIVITIAVLFLIMASGVGIGPLLKKLVNAGLKRLSGESTEVNVNLGVAGTQEMSRHSSEMGDIMVRGKNSMCADCPGLVDPGKCPLHEREVAGRQANEKAIKEIKEEMIRIWQHHEELKKDLQRDLKDGLAEVKKVATENKDAIIGNQNILMGKLDRIMNKSGI